MRLINVEFMKLEEFMEDQTPPYTILSHTWGNEEVTFKDFISGEYQHMKGYSKLRGCCRLSRQDGYEYTWIDTCCIDKSSSAELSEAINSMFRWYERSEVCYAYLSDVGPKSREEIPLEKSRWFTRGWTLQELIAPATVVFYESTWQEIGIKSDPPFAERLAAITGIDQLLLQHVGSDMSVSERLRNYTIAQRMSWAATRRTTRVEDEAYCLLGLFDVNIPLLYGESNKAFLRLQQEIMKGSSDSSIFAWRYRRPPTAITHRNRASIETLGLLATSPWYFEGLNDVEPCEYQYLPPAASGDNPFPKASRRFQINWPEVGLEVSAVGFPAKSHAVTISEVCLVADETWKEQVKPQVSAKAALLPELDDLIREWYYDQCPHQPAWFIMLQCKNSLGRMGFIARPSPGDDVLERVEFVSPAGLMVQPRVDSWVLLPDTTRHFFHLVRPTQSLEHRDWNWNWTMVRAHIPQPTRHFATVKLASRRVAWNVRNPQEFGISIRPTDVQQSRRHYIWLQFPKDLVGEDTSLVLVLAGEYDDSPIPDGDTKSYLDFKRRRILMGCAITDKVLGADEETRNLAQDVALRPAMEMNGRTFGVGAGYELLLKFRPSSRQTNQVLLLMVDGVGNPILHRDYWEVKGDGAGK
jgi:hypothetical protein